MTEIVRRLCMVSLLCQLQTSPGKHRKTPGARDSSPFLRKPQDHLHALRGTGFQTGRYSQDIWPVCEREYLWDNMQLYHPRLLLLPLFQWPSIAFATRRCRIASDLAP